MISAICLLALVLAACGGADSDGDANTNQTNPVADDSGGSDSNEPTGGGDDEPSEESGSSGLPGSGTGTVTVGGGTIESQAVLNCTIAEQFDPQPGDLDITASFGGIEALFLEIANIELAMGPDSVPYLQVRASMQLRDDSDEMALYEDAIYVQDQEGSWYEDADGAAGFTIARGETPETAPVGFTPWSLDGGRATGTVMLDAGSGPVEVTYDLEVADPIDCSL